MIYSSRNSASIQADDDLGEFQIRQDTFICDQAYDDSVCFSMLYSYRPIEISVVVSGQGIHKLLGQAIPCEAGDIYIVNSNVPHRYFFAEAGKNLVIRRILFDPKDWLEKESAQPTNSHFCCGVFEENPIAAYAMLINK